VLLMAALAGGLAAPDSQGAEGPAAAPAVAASAVELSGVTLDGFGRVLPQVRILARPVGGEDSKARLHTAFSDERGRFSMEHLSPGAYDIVALKGGYSVLVARVNTALERTLELILRPSGKAGPEGSQPQDESWALRLPERDPLESRKAAPRGQERSSSPRNAPGGRVMLAASHLAWADGATEELHANYAQSFDLGESGELQAALRHRSRSGTGGEWERDDVDAIGAAWVPPEGATALWPRLELSGSRRVRGVPLGGGTLLSALEQAEIARVSSSWGRRDGPQPRSVSLDVAGLWLREARRGGASEAVREETSTATRIAVSAVEERTWTGLGGAHRTRLEARGAVSEGVRDAASDRADVALALEPNAPALEAVGRDNLDLRVVDRYARSAGLQLITRARAGWIDDVEQAAAGAASAGARWEMIEGLVLSAEAGVADAGPAGSDAVWTLGLSGDNGRWSWSVSREGGTAFAPWGRRGVEGAELVDPSHAFVLTSRGADSEGWNASIAWEGRAGWPSIRLRGETLRALGGVAVRLPEDVARVPVASDGVAESREWGLLMELPRTGTWLELSLARVQDGADEPELLSGAKVWRRQIVHVRQRLGHSSWSGATWHLALAFERADVADRAGTDADTPRLAMLDRSRFLGGVSLAF
jgi:hypothetical protein